MEKIILASASPRRRELLKLAGIPFEAVVSNAPETITKREPDKIVEELSTQKARAVAKLLEEKNRDKIILGADTLVYLDGEVLGKPKDAADALRMLTALQGRSHSVFTGVTLLKGEREVTFSVHTRVRVHALSPDEIQAYIATGEPFDKAGAYGIQGPFAVYIDEIQGDYHNVVGLPLARVYQEMKALV